MISRIEKLAGRQTLNATAFLAYGIAGAAPEGMGEPSVDAAGRGFARLLGQPVLVFAASGEGLLAAWRVAIERVLTRDAHVRAMVSTGQTRRTAPPSWPSPRRHPTSSGWRCAGRARRSSGRRRGCRRTAERAAAGPLDGAAEPPAVRPRPGRGRLAFPLRSWTLYVLLAA